MPDNKEQLEEMDAARSPEELAMLRKQDREALETARALNDELRGREMELKRQIAVLEQRHEEVRASLGSTLRTINDWAPREGTDPAIEVVRMFGKIEQLLHDMIGRL